MSSLPSRCKVCGETEQYEPTRGWDGVILYLNFKCGATYNDDKGTWSQGCKRSGKMALALADQVALLRIRIGHLEADLSASKKKVTILEGQLEYVSVECPDCHGDGSLGLAKDGRQISCELCGGYEDRLGFGRIPTGCEAQLEVLKAQLDTNRIASNINRETTYARGYMSGLAQANQDQGPAVNSDGFTQAEEAEIERRIEEHDLEEMKHGDVGDQ